MKRKRTLIIPTLILMLLSAGCNQDTVNDPDTEITPIVIGQGMECGVTAKQNVVVKTAEEFQNLKTMIGNFDNFTDTIIDFDRYQVIAVFDGRRGNQDYSINITKIKEYSDVIIVTVESATTGIISNVASQAFEVIKIPVSDKKIVFNDLVSECNECDSLYYYYYGRKIFVDQYLLNDWLLVGFWYQTSDAEMVNFINQTGMFHTVDASNITTRARNTDEYHLMFINLNESKTCSELIGIISTLEESPIVAFADFAFCCSSLEVCTKRTSSSYYTFTVGLSYTNNISDLYVVAAETNTLVIGADPWSPWDANCYSVITNKFSKGNAMQMANYFYETGKFPVTSVDIIGCTYY